MSVTETEQTELNRRTKRVRIEFNKKTGEYRVIKPRPKGVTVRGQVTTPKVPTPRKQYTLTMSFELWDKIIGTCPKEMSFNRYLIAIVTEAIFHEIKEPNWRNKTDDTLTRAEILRLNQ